MSYYCRECTTEELRPSAFTWYELPMLLLLVRPYRCPHCFRRYWRLINPF